MKSGRIVAIKYDRIEAFYSPYRGRILAISNLPFSPIYIKQDRIFQFKILLELDSLDTKF